MISLILALQAAGETPDYGQFQETVAAAACIMAAVVALRLGFMQRQGSAWTPPDEAVSKGVTQVSALITVVFLALFYVFLRAPEQIVPLAVLTVISLCLAVGGLLWMTNLMKKQGYPGDDHKRWSGTKLGGSELTPEARKIEADRQLPWDRLVEEADGRMPVVFTRASLASAHTRATIGFLLLQAFGTLALGGVGLLLAGQV